MHVSSPQCILRTSLQRPPAMLAPRSRHSVSRTVIARPSPQPVKPGTAAGQELLPRGRCPSSTCPGIRVRTREHTHTQCSPKCTPRSNEKHLCGKEREDVPLCGLSWQQEKVHCSEAGAGWCVVKETHHALREVLSGHFSRRQPRDGHVGQAGSQVGQQHRMSVRWRRKPDW